MPEAANRYRAAQNDPSRLIDELETLYAWAYQAAGANGAPVEVLDALSEQRLPAEWGGQQWPKQPIDMEIVLDGTPMKGTLYPEGTATEQIRHVEPSSHDAIQELVPFHGPTHEDEASILQARGREFELLVGCKWVRNLNASGLVPCTFHSEFPYRMIPEATQSTIVEMVAFDGPTHRTEALALQASGRRFASQGDRNDRWANGVWEFIDQAPALYRMLPEVTAVSDDRTKPKAPQPIAILCGSWHNDPFFPMTPEVPTCQQ